MPFININMDEVQESKPADPGIYELMITDAKPGESKNGHSQIVVSLGFIGQSNIPNITHYQSVPEASDDPDKMMNKARFLKRLLEHFSVPYDKSGIDVEKVAFDMRGCSAMTQVTLSEPDEKGNVYNRINIPRFKN